MTPKEARILAKAFVAELVRALREELDPTPPTPVPMQCDEAFVLDTIRQLEKRLGPRIDEVLIADVTKLRLPATMTIVATLRAAGQIWNHASERLPDYHTYPISTPEIAGRDLLAIPVPR